MSTIGNAYRGTLDASGPNTGLTPLATAVLAGSPDQVEQLLNRGAEPHLRCRDGQTPLLLAAWKAPAERLLIVQMLLSRIPKEYIDDTCELAENNTPIMCAIENRDEECVRLLARAGARLHIKNDDGFNVMGVAKNTGKRSLYNALFPEKEGWNLSRFSHHVMSFGSHIVSYAGKAIRGVGKMFGFKGKRHESFEKAFKATRPAPAPAPALAPEEIKSQEILRQVDMVVEDLPALKAFKGSKAFFHNLAKKTVELSNDTSTDLGSPEVLPKTIKVTLHQQVIYCDDSGSMVNKKGKAENRWENQMALALRIARITTLILPDGEGVALRFINQRTNESSSLGVEGIKQALETATVAGDTAIGTGLRERILRPLVYEPLAEGTLRRPLLVSILTDGGPMPEAKETLTNVIIECGNILEAGGYPRDCVKFLVGQVGTSKEAVDFLDRLSRTRRENPNVARVLHIHAGRWDDKFRSFRDERKLDLWLVNTLYGSISAPPVNEKEEA